MTTAPLGSSSGSGHMDEIFFFSVSPFVYPVAY